MKEQKKLITRPPVVVVLGHVDHGKSSLLCAIKDFKILERESGGITQHIGAYEIEHQGKKITFIDTPGHEAFSQMRSRGAKVADIAILVVDTAEGVKEQTKEAISHAKLAGVPIIVALNKIDKPQADPTKIKRELSQNKILVEELGGKIPSVETSAITKKGIPELLEIILLVADMEELKANFEKPAEGVVIEAYLDSQRGPTATLLIRDGILKKGDILATPSTLGKAKILEDFQGKPVEETFPSQPVIILGFEKVPQVSETFKVFPDIKEAEKYLTPKEERKEERKVLVVEPGQKILNLILKGDCFGSLEAIEGVLRNLPQDKVILRILKKEVGNINESDIKLAHSARAKVLGFRVKTDSVAQRLVGQLKIKPINFEIIYELVQSLRQLMEKMLKPEVIKKELGRMKTLVVFWAEKNRQIVGGRILEGEVKREKTSIEVYREKELKGRGKLVNLQKNKKDIAIAGKGEEIGILYEGDVKIEKGDEIVFYQQERKKVEL